MYFIEAHQRTMILSLYILILAEMHARNWLGINILGQVRVHSNRGGDLNEVHRVSYSKPLPYFMYVSGQWRRTCPTPTLTVSPVYQFRLCVYIPGGLHQSEMACIPATISRRGHSHSSRRRWLWSTCGSEGPQGLST